MIFKIFRTEYKPYLLVVSLCLAACTAVAAALGIAGLYGSDARAAELAGGAFTVFNAACNFMPLLLFILAAVGAGTKCLRTAGVKERDILLGRMFELFAWTAIFVLAEMLLVTAEQAWHISRPLVDFGARQPVGVGDVTSGLLLVKLLQGASLQQALEHVTAAVYEVMITTKEMHEYELQVVAAQDRIAKPEHYFSATQL